MATVQSSLTTRLSAVAGTASLVIGVLLAVVGFLLFRNGATTLLPWVWGLAGVELVIGLVLVWPLKFRVVADDAGVRNTGAFAWDLAWTQVKRASVITRNAKEAAIAVEPTDPKLRGSRGYTRLSGTPKNGRVAPVSYDTAAAFRELFGTAPWEATGGQSPASPTEAVDATGQPATQGPAPDATVQTTPDEPATATAQLPAEADQAPASTDSPYTPARAESAEQGGVHNAEVDGDTPR